MSSREPFTCNGSCLQGFLANAHWICTQSMWKLRGELLGAFGLQSRERMRDRKKVARGRERLCHLVGLSVG